MVCFSYLLFLFVLVTSWLFVQAFFFFLLLKTRIVCNKIMDTIQSSRWGLCFSREDLCVSGRILIWRNLLTYSSWSWVLVFVRWAFWETWLCSPDHLLLIGWDSAPTASSERLPKALFTSQLSALSLPLKLSVACLLDLEVQRYPQSLTTEGDGESVPSMLLGQTGAAGIQTLTSMVAVLHLPCGLSQTVPSW